jgi:hypothetical protein
MNTRTSGLSGRYALPMEIADVPAISTVRKESSFDTLSTGANTLSFAPSSLSIPARILSYAIYTLSRVSDTLSNGLRWAKNDTCALSAGGRNPSSAVKRLSGAAHQPFYGALTLSNPSNPVICQ